MSIFHKFPLCIETDFYNLTMANAYFNLGLHETRAVFHLSFRNNPFSGSFIMCVGLATVIDAILQDQKLNEEQLCFLRQLKDSKGKQLLSESFLQYLMDIKFDCDIYSVAEGTIVFPNEPVLRVEGPIVQCQLLETFLLNTIGFQSLIATKAARLNIAAAGTPVIELGMRHAQGINGALSASRAAFIGGCVGTSNVSAGYMFGIPTKGTMSHSWVMFFEDEAQAFNAFADTFPNDNTFLVDTYSTVGGVKNAIQAAKSISGSGKTLSAIRLDSGDLTFLSKEARRMLDDAGLHDVKIIASNELDEYAIQKIKENAGKIDCFGVGTKLVTGNETPALGCVYKLSAIREKPEDKWQHRIKVSEQAVKTTTPGVQQVRRFYDDMGMYLEDVIFNEEDKAPENSKNYKDLLQPINRNNPSKIQDIQKYALEELSRLPEELKSLTSPAKYTVQLDHPLQRLKDTLIQKAKGLLF